MISIVVPIYNRERTIIKTLDSIKKQSFNDWECLVVDDKSLDNSLEVVKEYAKTDKRFVCFSNNRKKGAQGARNTGVLNAKGEFVVFFDSDDLMHPDFLIKVYNKVKLDNADICGSFLRLLDSEDNVVGSIRWKGYGQIHNGIVNGKTYFCNDSTIIRRQKLLDINLLDEECTSYQEWETHLRLSKIANYTTVEEELVDYYRGGADTISQNNSRAIKGALYIINKNKKEFLFDYPCSLQKRAIWVYGMIDKERRNGGEYIELKKEYKEVIPWVYRLVPSIMFGCKALFFKTNARSGR